MFTIFQVLSIPLELGVSNPEITTFSSSKPSLLSSGSALFPMPSLSESLDSVASNGKASSPSMAPSLSSSTSTLFPSPSPSVSMHSLGSLGNTSWVFMHPSPSISVSLQSGTPSWSKSAGRSSLSKGSLLHSSSSRSVKLSLSSSSSALLPMPSASVSVHSLGSIGKASWASFTPSLSLS